MITPAPLAPTKTVLINGRFVTQRVTGVQRYALEVLRAMESVSEVSQLALLLPTLQRRMPYPLFKSLPVHYVGCGSGHIWEQFAVPTVATHPLLNLCNTYPILLRRQLVVVHDASVYAMPGGYTRTFVAFYRFLFGLLRFKPYVQIVTDSNFSRRELARYARLPEERIQVVYAGADHWKRVRLDEAVLDRLSLRGKSFVLAVASDNPNKNLARLMDAFESLKRHDTYLVLVGGGNNSVFSETRKITSNKVIRAGYLPDAELAALYSAATCFAFPSLYEGFGLPPLEAMISGCPVLVSQEASLPEVCGEAALYCDGYSESDIAAKMNLLIEDAALRDRLRAAGYVQSARYKWSNTAQSLLEIARAMR